ncbi:hypothetical protein HID58_092066 [Brassica napus]|uniref:Uncharacterized protein n=1 Tax=Brassica napus TaxID=3708 RepID=A0ABQ7WZ74_BRANA|nr:hypothetical protein HID58_092066 [Brassica napus]
MIYVFKTIRPLSSTTVSFLSPRCRTGNNVTGLSFATASDQQKMDKKPENPNEKTGFGRDHVAFVWRRVRNEV